MPIPPDYPPFESAEERLLFECKLEIEERWMSDEEPEAVHRLAREHPTLGKELYLFFADMLETHIEPLSRRPSSAARGANVPKPFLALLRDAAGESVYDIAASMDITPDFLVDLSDHGRVVPLAARRELVRRAQTGRAIDEAEAIASFDVVSLRRAASRRTEFTESTETFTDVVKRSSLSAQQQQFWASLD
ncbi:MAG TPA: hypothetical protein VGM82_09415 [Gemmatimonadaceae bacterium]|jgi:hypothetical protein